MMRLCAYCCRYVTALAVLAACSVGQAQDFKFFELTVLDENGKPLVDVPVEIKMDGLKFPMPSDDLGMISMNVSDETGVVELTIRHDGYESQKIRWRSGREVPEQHTIKLKPGEPSEGSVVDAAGQPVTGAEIFAAPPDESLSLLNGRNPPQSEQVAVVSDEQGKFTLPYQSKGATIVCVSDAGWAQFVIPKGDDDEPLAIKLKPWGRVQLTTPQPDETVGIYFINALPKDQGQVQWQYAGKTDGDGNCNFDRVIQGTGMAYREAPIDLLAGQQPSVENRSHGVVVTLQAGTQQIALGEAKQRANGKLVMPVDYPGAPIWKSGVAVLTEDNVVDLAMRTLIFEYGKLLSQSNVYDQRQRVPPSMEPNYLVRYLAPIKPDGTFVIDGLPAGNYKLSAIVPAQPKLDRRTTDVLTIEELPFVIPKAEGDASVDLGVHVLDHTGSFLKPN